MNEHDQDPTLEPEEEARIQALLADLNDAPDAAQMPPDVAARLDETLAGLVTERAGAPAEATGTTGTVVPMRRRWVTRATAAAAAVIVVGVGGVAAANLFGGQSDSMTSAGGAASSKTESQDDSGGASAPTTPPDNANGLLARDLPRVTAASFAADVEALAGSPKQLRAAARQQQSAEDNAGGDTASAGTCSGPSADDGATHLVVLYDGTPAALLLHPEEGGSRLVEAWTCGGDRLLDSATVPVGVPTSGKSGSGLGSPTPSP